MLSHRFWTTGITCESHHATFREPGVNSDREPLRLQNLNRVRAWHVDLASRWWVSWLGLIAGGVMEASRKGHPAVR
jgi:hypothetical protein